MMQVDGEGADNCCGDSCSSETELEKPVDQEARGILGINFIGR